MTPNAVLQALATTFLLSAAAGLTNQESRALAAATQARLEDCARCGVSFRQYAACADFIGMKAVYLATRGAHGSDGGVLRAYVERKLVRARLAGLSGQNNSTFCGGVVSAYYEVDGSLQAACTGVCECRFGQTIRARALTPDAAVAEGSSRCARGTPSCSPGCSCKNCMDYKSYTIPKGKGFEAVVGCAAGAFGGEKNVPCA